MIWKPVPNFPKYVASSTGLVANKKDYKPLAISYKKTNVTTYARVTLFKEGIRYYKQLHRIIAETFLANPNQLPEVDHKDANGLNNHINNLEWVTRATNIQRAFARNSDIKRSICAKGGKLGGAALQRKAEEKYSNMLQERFIKFYPAKTIYSTAAVRYQCKCGILRTASIMWKELRAHNGICPICTNTVKRSSQSLE